MFVYTWPLSQPRPLSPLGQKENNTQMTTKWLKEPFVKTLGKDDILLMNKAHVEASYLLESKPLFKSEIKSRLD